MSPFHDLGRHCAGLIPAGRARDLLSSRPPPSAGWTAAGDAEAEGLPLSRFAWLLALGILGLAGLLSLGVGGIGLVQRSAFPASRIGEPPSPRPDVRHGWNASTVTTGGTPPAGRHAAKASGRATPARPVVSPRAVTERRPGIRATPSAPGAPRPGLP